METLDCVIYIICLLVVANRILRLAVDGRLCMAMRPPNYTAEKGNRQNSVFGVLVHFFLEVAVPLPVEALRVISLHMQGCYLL